MTLVLSVNPFLDPEGDAPLSAYPPIWGTDRSRETRLAQPDPACSSPEASCRRGPDRGSRSRSAYFKRKFAADDEDPLLSFRTYCQPVAPVQEERAHVLRLSLEKMRYMDDPEVFLRRSVLINNLLHRLRAEILLPSTNWCFPPNPVLTSGPWNLPPTAGSAHQALHWALPTRICLPPPAGPPFRKRFRVVPSGPGPDCSQTCCCVYEAAGHCLQLPLSMYDAALSSTGSTSKLHLTGQGKPGPSMDKEEDKDAEEEEEERE